MYVEHRRAFSLEVAFAGKIGCEQIVLARDVPDDEVISSPCSSSVAERAGSDAGLTFVSRSTFHPVLVLVAAQVTLQLLFLRQ